MIAKEPILAAILKKYIKSIQALCKSRVERLGPCRIKYQGQFAMIC